MSIFKVQLDEALGRLATAPTRRHAGTRLRSSIALQSPIELLHTESKVLPESDQVGVRAPKRAKSRCTMKVGDLGWVSSDADTICTVFCNTTTCVIDHSPPL